MKKIQKSLSALSNTSQFFPKKTGVFLLVQLSSVVHFWLLEIVSYLLNFQQLNWRNLATKRCFSKQLTYHWFLLPGPLVLGVELCNQSI